MRFRRPAGYPTAGREVHRVQPPTCEDSKFQSVPLQNVMLDTDETDRQVNNRRSFLFCACEPGDTPE